MSLILAAAQSASVPGDLSANIANHARFARSAAEHRVQLLVFPELSLTGYELDLAQANIVDPESPKLDPLRHVAEEGKMTIVVGAPVANEKGQLYIAALALRPDSAVLTYAKVHVHESEQHVFHPGPGGPVLEIQDTTVALAICADASTPCTRRTPLGSAQMSTPPGR